MLLGYLCNMVLLKISKYWSQNGGYHFASFVPLGITLLVALHSRDLACPLSVTCTCLPHRTYLPRHPQPFTLRPHRSRSFTPCSRCSWPSASRLSAFVARPYPRRTLRDLSHCVLAVQGFPCPFPCVSMGKWSSVRNFFLLFGLFFLAVVKKEVSRSSRMIHGEDSQNLELGG